MTSSRDIWLDSTAIFYKWLFDEREKHIIDIRHDNLNPNQQAKSSYVIKNRAFIKTFWQHCIDT